MTSLPSAEREHADSTAPPAVALQHVSRLYGSFVALLDLSLTLPAGASVVLLGENGAGKSTLLKLIAGLAAPSSVASSAGGGGSVRVLGLPPQQQRGRIGYMGHASMLYDELTALENLSYLAEVQGIPLVGEGRRSAQISSLASEALRSVGLQDASSRRVGEFSQGMRQRASLARVLMTAPDLLLLDEPFSNLDAASAQVLIARLQAYLHEPGTDRLARTLILTTHQAELARPLAHTTLTLQAGRIASLVEAAQ